MTSPLLPPPDAPAALWRNAALAGAPLDVRRWAVVAVLTFVLGQADRLFQHPTQPMGTLLLAPGCVLACLWWWGTRY
jgi:hypothetical protein